MRTRCPACSTVFRVTSEQLRLKAGKVRCGHCQTLFNAFDQLVVETPTAETPVVPFSIPVEPSKIQEPSALGPETVMVFDVVPDDRANFPAEPIAEPEPAFVALAESQPEPEPEPEPIAESASESEAATEFNAESVTEAEALAEIAASPVERLADGETLTETPEESTLAAREVGLVAVRELSDVAGHNRWAAGTLASGGLGGFAGESAKPALWPYVLFLLVLVLLLLGQLFYHFRTEVVQRLPDAASLYQMAAIDVPLPRNVEQVAIETSDLQSDNQRGMFVLQATLRNRAAYAQAWPDLELTLTDTHDTVVSRRVLAPTDYLPPAVPPGIFPANAETAIRLWVEAKDIGAAGYRLYVFYP